MTKQWRVTRYHFCNTLFLLIILSSSNYEFCERSFLSRKSVFNFDFPSFSFLGHGNSGGSCPCQALLLYRHLAYISQRFHPLLYLEGAPRWQYFGFHYIPSRRYISTCRRIRESMRTNIWGADQTHRPKIGWWLCCDTDRTFRSQGKSPLYNRQYAVSRTSHEIDDENEDYIREKNMTASW